MRRKFTNLLVLALAFSSAGFVTSCKDTEEDTLVQYKQELIDGYTDALADQDANLKTLLAAQVKGLQGQIDAINTALAAIKSCTCGDGTLDAHIQAMIDQSITDALANNGDKYMTESDVAAAITKAINDVIAKLSDAQKAEVQKMIEDYAAAHPSISKSEVEALIKEYLVTNPGLTKDDVEAIITAYLAKNPQGLTKDDVETIVTAWIYDHQILSKDQVDALIEAAITKALAGYALKSEVPTQAYIEDLIKKAIDAYAATDQHLSATEVDDMIDKAIKAAMAGWKEGMTQPEVENLVTKAIQAALDKYTTDHPYISASDIALEIQKAITEAVKDLLPKEALNNYPTTAEVNDLIAKALEKVQPGMSEDAIKNLVNEIVTEALKGVNTGLTEDQVKNLVNEIVTQRLKNYTTEDGVKALINDAVKQFLADYATTDKVQLLINDAIAKALEGLTTGMTAAEVKNLITEAIKDVITKDEIATYLAPYTTTKDVLDVVEDELEKALKAYSTTAEVQALIDAAKCACSCLTPEQVAKIASSVLNDWLVAHPYPTSLTKDDVESIAKNVVNDAQVIKDLKDAQRQLFDTLTGVQKDIATLQEATKGISTLTEDVNKNKVDIAKLQQAIDDLDLSQYVTTAVLTAELGKVQTAIEAAQAKADLAYEEAQKALSKYEDAMKAIAAAQKENNSKFAEVWKALGQTEDDLTQKMIDGYKDLVGKIGDVKDALSTLESKLESEIGDVKKDAAAALALANSNADKIETLDQTLHWVLYKLGLLEGIVEGLVPGQPVDLSTLISAIADLKTEVDGIKKDYATKKELAQAVADLTAAYKAADALQNLVIAGLTTAVAGMEAQILTITGQLGVIEGQLAVLDGKVTTLDGKVGALEGKVTLLYKNVILPLVAQVQLQEGKIASIIGALKWLNGKVTTIEGKVNTLEGDVAALQGDVANLDIRMTDAEGNITTLQGNVSTLKTYLNTLYNRVEDYKKAVKKALNAVQAEVDKVKSDVATNKSNIEANKAAINKLTETVKKIVTAIDKQITGVIVQGTYNPMYGTFNIPAGINSNVLVAFYGKADTNYEFPSSEISYYADASVTKIAKLTDADLAMIGAVDGQINGFAGTLISSEDYNAGKVYVTINPAGTDFSGAPVSLVNSLDEESGIELHNLKPVDKLLTFGYTRSVSNGLYAANAHLSKSDISKVKVKIDREKLATAFKDAFKTAKSAVSGGSVSGTFPSIATLVGTLYNQFNGILPALAVKADYLNAEGYTRSIYSNYGIAATAVRAPGFSPDFWNKVEQKFLTPDDKVRGYYSIMNVIYKLNRRAKTIIKEQIISRIKDNALVKQMDKVGDDISHIDIKQMDLNDANKYEVEIYMDASNVSDFVIKGDDTKSFFKYDSASGKTYCVISFVADARELMEMFNYDMNNTAVLVDDLKDLFNQVNTYLGNLESYETRIEKKADETIQKYLDQINGKLVNFIKNISDRVQPIALFVEGNKISQLGGALGAVKKVSTSSITIYPTTYTAEVITPCYKKHVAVTNVYQGSTSAQDGDAACKAALQKANKGENMNKVINGGIHQTVTLNLADDFIYEIAYSALDYNGQIATRKYYVAKK